MLTELFVVATESTKAPVAHLSSALKDVGIFVHEFQPQPSIRHGFKKSSISKNCLAVTDSHIFAAQAGKAVVNVYSREKQNQEATVPFPQKISSLTACQNASLVVIGTEDGRLMFWEIATGRITNSAALHIEPVTVLKFSPCGEYVISASPDSNLYIWSVSTIISISVEDNSLGSTQFHTEPVASFSHHRSAVNAISIGHSQQATTNIVVSASEDRICYVWNLGTQAILRTVLLYETPQCVILDPVDRAAYIGSSEGNVQMIDIVGRHSSSIVTTSQRDAAVPMQLRSEDVWKFTGSSNSDTAHCVDVSYDGTSLITGHESGSIVQWDVGKRRMARVLSGLSGQPVTNLELLRPLGFDSQSQSRFGIHNVVKPRLDLSQASNHGQQGVVSSVPADMTLNAQVKRQPNNRQQSDEILRALETSELPQLMLDDAVQSLLTKKVSSGQTKTHTDSADEDARQVEDMRKELDTLRNEVAIQNRSNQARLEKHMNRMKRREALGLEKRQAYFTAKRNGRDGDQAMNSFIPLEHEIDQESDEEAIAQGADVTMRD